MADLTRYVSSKLRNSTPVDLYILKARAGEGVVERMEPLYLKMTAKGKFFGIKFDASVEITMPDLAPKGECMLKVADNPPVTAKYWVEDGRLRMDRYDLTLYPAGNYTWVWVTVSGLKKGWVGVWPQGLTMSEEDEDELMEKAGESAD